MPRKAEFSDAAFKRQQARVEAERRAEKKRAREAIRGMKAAPPKLKRWGGGSSAGRGKPGRVRATASAFAGIVKVSNGGSAGEPYALRQEGAELLFTDVLPSDPASRRREWEVEQARHPGVSTLIQHTSISRPPGHPLTREQWLQLVDAWLRHIGAEGVTHTIVRHPPAADRGHDHVHVVWSRARPDGRLVSTSWNFRRWHDALQEAAREVGVSFVTVAPEVTQRPSDRAVSAQRRARRNGGLDPWVDPRTVRAALARSRSPAELQEHLARAGIELQLRLDREGNPSGLLLRRNGAQEWLAGSTVARDLSLPQVQARLTQNARRSQLRPGAPLPGDGQAPTYPRERGG